MNLKAIVLAAILGGLVSTALTQASLAHSGAPSLVTWTDGTPLTATDLNNSFAHIHNTFSGGITNAMVATNAAIAHSKLATPMLVPKAWGVTVDSSACTTGTCTLVVSSGVTSIVHSSTGVYVVTLSYTPTDAYFFTSASSSNGAVFCYTSSVQTTAPQFVVTCHNDAGAATDTNLNVLVLDN